MVTHPIGGKQKCSKQWKNTNKKLLETVFSVANWQSKTLFQTIFYLRSSIVLIFLIVNYPLWVMIPQYVSKLLMIISKIVEHRL